MATNLKLRAYQSFHGALRQSSKLDDDLTLTGASRIDSVTVSHFLREVAQVGRFAPVFVLRDRWSLQTRDDYLEPILRRIGPEQTRHRVDEVMCEMPLLYGSPQHLQYTTRKHPPSRNSDDARDSDVDIVSDPRLRQHI